VPSVGVPRLGLSIRVHRLLSMLAGDSHSYPSYPSGSSHIATDGHSASLSRCRAPRMGGLHVVGRSPWREDGSVIYLYNLLSLSGPSSVELMTTAYCLSWDSPQSIGPGPRIYIPGTGWPSYTPGHWVPILSPLTNSQGYGGSILTRLHTGR
jgi:hypothetical protein